MGLLRHRARESSLLYLEPHFKALLLGLEFIGKYFCGIFITTSSLKTFLPCGMLVPSDISLQNLVSALAFILDATWRYLEQETSYKH